MEQWSKGKAIGTVITDTIEGLPEDSGHVGTDAYVYYGGALVCESIWRKKDAVLISAAPDMLEALQILIGDIERHPKKFTKEEKIKIAKAAILKATTI